VVCDQPTVNLCQYCRKRQVYSFLSDVSQHMPNMSTNTNRHCAIWLAGILCSAHINITWLLSILYHSQRRVNKLHCCHYFWYYPLHSMDTARVIPRVAWSWDDWSWSTHGNLLCACYTDHWRQVAHRQYKFQSRWWLRSLQVRAMHKRYLIVRNSAHDFSVKLVFHCDSFTMRNTESDLRWGWLGLACKNSVKQSSCICSYTESSVLAVCLCTPRYLVVHDKFCFVQ